ncbi:hypothetical protein A4H97_17185 [Niastella yeongjuensis]|uniref:Uncharacterized protein n=1 Tax=Niastella yeongjuensis TaxID=354355 RepID=A0A1V9E1L0_9BACT|nr:hypothetical protein [Niastella yeongjuensis]OQP39951.1 hypothetical protein A4H97_17185 [Niastella yeongjuensis]SEO11396.1 hypothetical protein SAMN05660816_02181 [Niastella yeongjuensis]
MPGAVKNKEEKKGLKKVAPYKIKKKSADSNVNKSGSADGLKMLRSYSELGFVRTNSVNDLGSLLKHSERNLANAEHTAMAVDDREYFSVIGVFSREASRNFGKAWQSQMLTGPPGQRMTGNSMADVSDKDIAAMDSRQSRTEVSTDFEEQIQALFKNKTVPHVIAVIEGKEEQNSFTFKTEVPMKDGKKEKKSSLASKTEKETKSIELGYKKMDFFQGYTGGGTKDHKQNMTYYVRRDLEKAYSVSEVKVDRNDEYITCAAVDYKTEDGKRYRSLIVHIPNKFIKTTGEVEKTNAAFVNYAKTVAKTNITVTNYLGDTNFKSPFFDKSVPSVGGHLKKGETLNPQSSGAQSETNFMQSVSLGKGEEGYSVLQPSVANYIFLKTDSDNKEATDHPSTINYVAHKSPIANRDPKVFPEYYPLEQVV